MKKFGVMILVLACVNAFGFSIAGNASLSKETNRKVRQNKQLIKTETIINIDFWKGFDDPFLTEYIVSAVKKLPIPAKKKLRSKEMKEYKNLCMKTAAQVADEYISLMCCDSLILYQGNLVSLISSKVSAESMVELHEAQKEYDNLLLKRQEILVGLTVLTGLSLERGLSLPRSRLEEFDFNDVLNNPSYLVGCAQRADRETITELKEQRIKTIELQKKYLKMKDKDVSAQLLTEREKLLKVAQEQVRTKGDRLKSYVDYYVSKE